MAQTNGEKTPHILSTSANLLGLCAVLITGIRVADYHGTTFFDEVLLIASFCMFISCALSYMSIRSTRESERYENWADYIFLAGLLLIFIGMVLLSKSVL